jgi:hypothetical protein
MVISSIQLQQGSSTWDYMIHSEIKPSASLAKAPLVGFGGQPRLKVTTMPDRSTPGHTGIGIELAMGNWTAGDDGHMPATLVVRDASGHIIHKGSADLGKFAFG